jgi:hypothetical protein
MDKQVAKINSAGALASLNLELIQAKVQRKSNQKTYQHQF